MSVPLAFVVVVSSVDDGALSTSVDSVWPHAFQAHRRIRDLRASQHYGQQVLHSISRHVVLGDADEQRLPSEPPD